ncbi:MAG: ABC transporter permease [Candidatus Omnitrophica bacterium]|nr:ABC transporter permease [Candidatus Omnitrophota bacterium]
MNLLNAILVGLKEVWAHKFRSLLTMLGIVLGVSSLVALAAVLNGMENGMKEALIALGGLDKVLLQDQEVPPAQEHLADQAPGRTMNDVYALQQCAPLIKLISPEMALRGVIMTRGDKSVRPSELVGVWPAVLDMNLHQVQYGRFFTTLDEERANNVVVIGTGIRDDLFGSPEDVGREIVPLGDAISINGQPFTIVGMFTRYESEEDKKMREYEKTHPPATLKGPARRRGWSGRRGSWAFWRKNYTAYIPLNAMWLRFRAASGANDTPDPTLTDIDLKVASLNVLEPALQQARNVLMITHKGIEDFTFGTQEDAVENINSAMRNARMSGGIIAAISLIVGGIGIMNIMLASITERIREIGLRKAIGANNASIFLQILVESVVIAVLGGVLGLAASYALVYLLTVLTPTQNSPVISWSAMLISFAFSAFVGVLAGLYPAIKAAKLDPIQALRFE